MSVLERLKRCWEVRRLLRIFADHNDLAGLELHIRKAQALKLTPQNCPELVEALKVVGELERVRALAERLLQSLQNLDLTAAEAALEEAVTTDTCLPDGTLVEVLEILDSVQRQLVLQARITQAVGDRQLELLEDLLQQLERLGGGGVEHEVRVVDVRL